MSIFYNILLLLRVVTSLGFMNVQQWFTLLIEQLKETDLLQWIAIALGVAEVLFARVNKIWLYPTGIAATLLSVFILYEAGLFAECLLNIYYIVMSVYGWWYWIKKKHLPPVKISRNNSREWLVTLLIALPGTALLYYILRYFTPSTVPLWDAWVSATAWAGMWLLARRKIENWALLNISNAFAVPLLFHKALPLYAALTIFLFIVAAQGYFKWNKIIRTEKEGNI